VTLSFWSQIFDDGFLGKESRESSSYEESRYEAEKHVSRKVITEAIDATHKQIIKYISHDDYVLSVSMVFEILLRIYKNCYFEPG